MKNNSPNLQHIIGLIGGTSLMNSEMFSSWKTRQVKTVYGVVGVQRSKNVIFLQRHGKMASPPHMINHRANIQAMKDLGAEKIIAVNSVGSLKTALSPGSFIVPDDFISLWQIPTFFDGEMRFTVPAMDRQLGESLYALCREQAVQLRLGGTYVQTIGPRFETKAEIRMLRNFGDAVGMTMASEATLSMEQGIPYASLCSIDNFCNGIIEIPLTIEQIAENVRNNIKTIEGVIEMLITRGLP
jgi:5'-methylthioadenosine phosphorylase